MQDAAHDKAPPTDEPWRSPLDELERTLSEVGRALSALRTSLENGGDSGGASPRMIAEPSEPPSEELDARANHEATPASSQAVWSRIQNERQEEEGAARDPADIAEEPASNEPEAMAADEATPTSFQAVWSRIQNERQEDEGAALDKTDNAEQPESDKPAAPASEYELNVEAEAVGKSRLSSFEGVWERLERERKERSDGDVEDIAEVRGLEHLPHSYRITVEDRDGTPVDLVPIHRALLTFAPPDNISLANFANGVPVVSIRVEGELDLERLATTIGAATSRHCEVIQQDKGKLFLRLSSEEGYEG